MSRARGHEAEPWQDSHPFITFRFNATRVPPATWALLGEASSKIEHVCGVPLQPGTAGELNQIFLAKGVHGTTAIEGNTLSEAEVKKRLQHELPLPESQEYLGKEIDNIVEAYNWIIEQIARGAPLHVGPGDLKRFNEMVLRGLEVDEDVVPGEYRGHVVGAGHYRSPSPAWTENLLDRLWEWLNQEAWTEVVGGRFVVPIMRAILAHLYIAWIHPFGDGNGRTARLVEFDILTRAGVPTVSAHLLSDHYNRTRAAYYRSLSQAQQDPAFFIAYAVRGLVDGLHSQLDLIRDQQIRVAWTNYVHERIGAELPHTPASERRRHVAIALSLEPSPVPQKTIPDLTRQLTRDYAGKTNKTLTRDLNQLELMSLVVAEPNGYRAKIEEVLAFLPLVNPGPPPEEEGEP